MKIYKLYQTVFISVCIFCCSITYGLGTVAGQTPIDTLLKTADSANNNTLLQTATYLNRQQVYKLRPAVDVPIIAVCGGWSAYLLLIKVYNKTPSTPEQIMSLNKNNVNAFDRLNMYGYNQTLDNESYYPFYAAFPLPLIFFLTGNDMRQDYAKLSFLYLETMSVMGVFASTATYEVSQYRPYAYDPATPMEKKITPNAKNSFLAGHVEVIAASTFFIAQVYSDYYPDSKIKWAFYGGAALATAGMGYVRITAGMHFTSDVLIGSAVGGLSGVLVPYFHKHKIIKNPNLSLTPYGGYKTPGLVMNYKF